MPDHRSVDILDSRAESAPRAAPQRRRRVAIFISCDSFEGFYGGTFGIDRETYLATYRNDFVWEYAEGLRRCGHEVVIYVLSYGKPERREVADGLSVRFLKLPPWLRVLDPLLYRTRAMKYGDRVRNEVAHFGYGAALKDALREDRIEVVYHQEIWTPRFDIMMRTLDVPVIGGDQGTVYADWMGPAKRQSIPRAARVLCQSLTTLDRANAFGGNTILMYNGVNTDFFTPPATDRPRPKTVLTVGRLVEPQKRFSDLLRAMVSLPDFTLLLVGSGPDEATLKRLAAELGIAARVTFAGFVSDRDALRRMYQECGVFVSTSNWEAVALVMLEAMSCAAPVVATRIPSFEDLLTDGSDGNLVPVAAPDDVARAIRVAHEQQQTLGRNARETVVTRYSSDALYRRLSDIIQAI